MSQKKGSSYSLPTRILAIALTALVASGVLTYLVWFFINLFS
jgi:hypothetical protein